jgi:hypothetical protein
MKLQHYFVTGLQSVLTIARVVEASERGQNYSKDTHVRTLILRITLGVIAFFQIALALVFLLIPGPFAAAVGLPEAPQWASWMFAMFSARALGYAVGMILAIRDPAKHRAWIITMVGVQAIDWIATLLFIGAGAITVAQASTAAFLPVVFIVVLLATMPRGRRQAIHESAKDSALIPS